MEDSGLSTPFCYGTRQNPVNFRRTGPNSVESRLISGDSRTVGKILQVVMECILPMELVVLAIALTRILRTKDGLARAGWNGAPTRCPSHEAEESRQQMSTWKTIEKQSHGSMIYELILPPFINIRCFKFVK
jgi:hypothetical protein